MKLARKIALNAFHTQNKIRSKPLSIRSKINKQIAMFDTADMRTIRDKGWVTKEGVSAWTEAIYELSRH